MLNPYQSGSVSDADRLAVRGSRSSASSAWVGAISGLKCSAVVIGGLLAAVLVGDLIYLASSYEYLHSLLIAASAVVAAPMLFVFVCPLAMALGALVVGIGEALPSHERTASAPSDPFAEEV